MFQWASIPVFYVRRWCLFIFLMISLLSLPVLESHSLSHTTLLLPLKRTWDEYQVVGEKLSSLLSCFVLLWAAAAPRLDQMHLHWCNPVPGCRKHLYFQSLIWKWFAGTVSYFCQGQRKNCYQFTSKTAPYNINRYFIYQPTDKSLNTNRRPEI